MELLRQAFTIMVLGMGLVFLFLYVVILAVQGTGALVRRYAPAEPEPAAPRVGADEPDEGELAAVIAVALNESKR